MKNRPIPTSGKGGNCNKNDEMRVEILKNPRQLINKINLLAYLDFK
jgi:hypothetical protein